MSQDIPTKILALLKRNMDRYFSMKEISEATGISLASVLLNVRLLRRRHWLRFSVCLGKRSKILIRLDEVLLNGEKS